MSLITRVPGDMWVRMISKSVSLSLCHLRNLFKPGPLYSDTWFSQSYLIANSIKTQGMLLGSHTHAYVPEFFIGDTKVELANSPKILGVTIDNKLTYCEHIISNMLKKSLCQDWCSKTS